MRLDSESRRNLVTNFSNRFIKRHGLKLEDVNTAKLSYHDPADVETTVSAIRRLVGMGLKVRK